MEEAEWAVEVCKATGKPTACSLCIGPEGDMHGVSAGDCAVRLVKAGILFFLIGKYEPGNHLNLNCLCASLQWPQCSQDVVPNIFLTSHGQF